jgi:hypothetical protein
MGNTVRKIVVVTNVVLRSLCFALASCATEAHPHHHASGTTLDNLYRDEVNNVLNVWNAANLPDASQCDPRDVAIVFMPRSQFNAPPFNGHNACGFFTDDTWVITLPADGRGFPPNLSVIDHETVHWLAGCTGRDPDYDIYHKDTALFGPTGVVKVATGTRPSGC